jgi:hypothetical protein
MAWYTSDHRWRVVRLVILERDGYVCQVRGPHCSVAATEVDHIVPVADGGLVFDPQNLRASCRNCNTGRAQAQKAEDGWRRSSTQIVLVCGPPGVCDQLSDYVASHATPGDLIIDYRSIAAAVGGRHEDVTKLRNSLLMKVRRGETQAARAWITSTNVKAEDFFPHHESVVIDPGREELERSQPLALLGFIDNWYAQRGPVARRAW